LQNGTPDALFGLAPKPDIDRDPLAVALVHFAPSAAQSQHVEHTIEDAPVIARWTRPATPLRRQQQPDQFPLRIRQVSTAPDCSAKTNLGSEPSDFGDPSFRHGHRK